MGKLVSMLATRRTTTHARFSLAWWEEVHCVAIDEAGSGIAPCYENNQIANLIEDCYSLNGGEMNEVGGIGPSIIVHRVSEVVGEVLQRSLAGDNGLHEKTKHREHCQPTVLKLLHLQLSKGLWIISQTQRVKAIARDALSVDQVRVAQIIQPTLAEDLGPGLEPHRLPELDAVASQELREHTAQCAQHGPP
ncbi:hypothetical protein IEQ34_006852 [Dendrobium chrysotoxum]|uniref:Uncharacterized protein n=1 Tax=Dendrobium chrysotoxum TaxID=161865 RepID=A0AAV7H5A6_DENCH|nr:hypothetical protein IEQ34_006852 [Dendrobium chrysotoxum]